MARPYIREIREQPQDPLGGASGEKRSFTVEFLGKAGNKDFPFTVANEVVAAELGRALGLNIPPTLAHSIGGETLVLVQMEDRDPRLQQEPPATAAALKECVQRDARMVHGAIVFDMFIANNDRAFGPERRNLSVGPGGVLQLYDHGNACFYRPRPSAQITCGVPRLERLEASLSELCDMDHKGNSYREYLTDLTLVREWCDRIRSLPDFFIEGVVARVPAVLPRPTAVERAALVKFLQKRRAYLYDHIVGSPGMFPGLPAGSRSEP